MITHVFINQSSFEIMQFYQHLMRAWLPAQTTRKSGSHLAIRVLMLFKSTTSANSYILYPI